MVSCCAPNCPFGYPEAPFWHPGWPFWRSRNPQWHPQDTLRPRPRCLSIWVGFDYFLVSTWELSWAVLDLRCQHGRWLTGPSVWWSGGGNAVRLRWLHVLKPQEIQMCLWDTTFSTYSLCYCIQGGLGVLYLSVFAMCDLMCYYRSCMLCLMRPMCYCFICVF